MIPRVTCSIALLFATTSSVQAQLHPDANDLAISFAADAFVARQAVPSVSEFDVYVLVVDAQDGLQQTEFALEGLGTSFEVIEERLLSLAENASTEPYVYVLSLPSCRSESLLPLLHLRVRATSYVEDGLICLTGPAVQDLGAYPSFQGCSGESPGSIELWPREDPREPGQYPDGCLVVNPSAGQDGSAQTIYSMPEIRGVPGQPVIMPLTADIQPVSGDDAPADVFAVEGWLRFDPDFLSLRDVSLDPTGPDWEVRFEEFQPGFWGVYAEDPALPAQPLDPPLGDLEGGTLLRFELDVLAPGPSDVFFDLREIVDSSPSTETPCCVVRNVATIRGAIMGVTVSADDTSIGLLKARFQH